MSKPRPPLERLLQSLGVEPDPSRSPLFQVFFVLQEDRLPDSLGEGLTLTPRPVDLDGAKFDLTPSVDLLEQDAVCQWEYDSDLFEASAIERFAGLFERLLGSALDTPEQLAQWRSESQGPRPPLPKPACVHQLFATHALQAPEAPAVSFDGGPWTHRDLDRRSNAVAQGLVELGVGLEDRVVVAVERSPEQLAALLGIMTAGAAYAPFDREEPAERFAFLTADLSARALVCGAANVKAFAARLAVCPLWWLGTKKKPNRLLRPLTGPISRTSSIPPAPRAGPRAAPLSFDASTFEIWGALTKGGCCVPAPSKLPSLDALRWAGRQGGANTCWLTAALFNLVMDEPAGPASSAWDWSMFSLTSRSVGFASSGATLTPCIPPKSSNPQRTLGFVGCSPPPWTMAESPGGRGVRLADGVHWRARAWRLREASSGEPMIAVTFASADSAK